MVNEIGKFLRILRLDKNETLKEMADRLEYAPSYLSAIEHGKRDAPKSLYDKVAALYGLSEKKAEEFKEILLRSRAVFEIDNDCGGAKQTLLVKMSNNEVSPQEYERILKILNTGK